MVGETHFYKNNYFDIEISFKILFHVILYLQYLKRQYDKYIIKIIVTYFIKCKDHVISNLFHRG